MAVLSQAHPAYRKLRGYAFDPSLSLLIDTIDINNIVYQVPWEAEDPANPAKGFQPGPIGEYLEVVDFDPTVPCYYQPVNLNDAYILASDGLAPSESNPQFHQQMVYTVAMITIQNFERALGRKILWAPRTTAEMGVQDEKYVQRLRLYPHALREANAYYSPQKKSILFGYFNAAPADSALMMPGSLVYTCLSHDIIAHEVTHAILDGLHRHYDQPSNPDVLAFHEAFADMVALFQHFTFPEVLKHQIARTRGNLEKQNLLGQLAQQFGSAIGRYGSLRDALGEVDEITKEWKMRPGKPSDYQTIIEPHERGAILVSAVFEAFMSIYKRRIQDLLRIATNGTGVLPEGELHPDLVNRLAGEAAKTAQHVLNMCIRAIDYCPPMDITFGDFLRAVITADCDLVDDDSHYYRLAFIEAFRRRGIYPEGVRSLSEESLRYWVNRDGLSNATKEQIGILTKFLRGYREAVTYETDRAGIFKKSREYITGKAENPESGPGIQGVHERLFTKFDNSREFEKLSGLVLNHDWKKLGIPADEEDEISFQILNLRLVSRVSPDGYQINQIVMSIVQKMELLVENGKIRPFDPDSDKTSMAERFDVHGGCTLIFDLDTLDLKHAIAKPLLSPDKFDQNNNPRINEEWIERQYRYQKEELPMAVSEISRYFYGGFNNLSEPFALLHNH